MNEEVRKKLEASEQHKKLLIQKKVNDGRNPELRELLQADQMAKDNIADLDKKLQEEIEKRNNILNEKIDLDNQYEENTINLEK
jgi:hypothetical protein